MKQKFIQRATIVLLLLLLSLTGATTAFGQSVADDGALDGPPVVGDPSDFPEPIEEESIEAAAPEFILAQPSYTMNYAGYVTDGSGNPINGAHDFSVSLYNADEGGDLRWGPEVHADVPVGHGLFNLVLGASVDLEPDVFDEALWLEIDVDGTVLPRVPLRPSAYAFGLVPGAEVQGTPTGNYALLVTNQDDDASGGTGTYSYGTRDGVYANGQRYGLYANTTESNGNAIYSGDFINAQGYRSRLDSWIYTPGMDGQLWTGETSVERNNHYYGYSALESTSGSAENAIFYIPIRVPAELMGQDVDLERVVIHYKTTNANTYLSDIELYKQLNYGESVVILYNESVTLDNTTASSFAFTPADSGSTPEDDRILNANEGILILRLQVHLEDGEAFYINGVGARIGHIQ